MNGTLDQTVESSNNFIVETDKDKLIFTNEIRGSFASTKYFILDKIKILAKLLMELLLHLMNILSGV